MFGDFSCSGAGCNKAERDGIDFRWISENFLFLYFPVPVRVGDETTAPNAALIYAPKQLRDYGSCGNFSNSYCTFTLSSEIFDDFRIKTNTIFYPDNYDRINKLLKKITDERNNSRPEAENMLFGLVMQLLAEAKRGQLPPDAVYGGKKGARARFEEIRDEYLSDLTNTPNIDDIIEKEYFSRSQFYRLYKQFFGTTPKNDLLNARLDCAKDLLIKTELSTAEIAELSGFKTQLGLYRAFRSRADCTVAQWRAEHSSMQP